jgi:pimeloyl-ACP methyl ester carboxylesterase
VKISFAYSPNGTRVAYDRCGSGPAIVLVHGGGGTRKEWYEAGYVRRLCLDFTVIALDLRGHGESSLPTDPAAYTTVKMGQDILSAVDACGFEPYSPWGMSFGGKISRYLAIESDRVATLILMGTQLGLGVSGQLCQEAIDNASIGRRSCKRSKTVYWIRKH